jgi:WD40 repeat protein
LIFVCSCEGNEPSSPYGSDTRWKKYTTICEKPYKEIILQDATVDFPLTLSSDHQKGLYRGLFGRDSHILLIDMNSGNRLMILETPLKSKSVQSAAFSSDGKRAVSGGGDTKDLSFWERLRGKKMKINWFLCFWDLASGKQIGHAKGQDDFIINVVYSPVDEKALSVGVNGDILLWDLEKMQVLKRFVGHSSGIRRGCLTWAKDGKTFLSGSWDGSIRLWSVESGKEIAKLNPGYGRVMSLALSPDGKYALSSYVSGTDQPVIFWDLEKQQEINRFGVPGHPRYTDQFLHVASVAFSPDGKSALFGLVFGTVIWWDLSEWKQIGMNRLYEDELAFVAYSADGKSCISMGCDTDRTTVKVKFWQLPDSDIIKEQK